MARFLRNLKINEISSVDVGAGRGVRVVLSKRAEQEKSKDLLLKSDLVELAKQVCERTVKAQIESVKKLGRKARLRKTSQDFNEAMAAQECVEDASELMNCIRQATWALDCSIQSILADGDVADKEAAISTSFDEFKTHLSTLAVEDDDEDDASKRDTNMTALSPALTEAINKTVAGALGTALPEALKAFGLTPVTIAKRDEPVVDDKDKLIAKLQADLEIAKMSDKHKAYHDSLGSDAAKAKFRNMSSDDKDAEMSKSLKRAEDDPVYKSLMAENVELKKRMEALEDDKSLAIAKKDADGMGLKQADAGEVVMKSRKGDKEAMAKFEKYVTELSKSKTAMEKTGRIFQELGTSNTGATGLTAYEELMAKAEELRKSDPKLTPAQAYDKVHNDPANAELRKRESDERMLKNYRAA